METLSHEKLHVYRFSIELLTELAKVANTVPRGYASLADQLRRASTSVVLNIAEGAGKVSPADKKRFFATARGSTFECSAVLDCLQMQGIINASRLTHIRPVIARIAAMLSKLAK